MALRSKEWRRAQVAAREQNVERLRAHLQKLRDQYGFRLGAAINKPRHIDSQTFPCRIDLLDGSVIDPCLMLFEFDERWLDFIDTFSVVYAGGQVAHIEPSDYALPPLIRKAALNTFEYRMGSYMPLLVSIAGERKYLMKAASNFFECGPYKGKDVDPAFFAEPGEAEYKKGRYVWGDDLVRRTALVLVEL